MGILTKEVEVKPTGKMIQYYRDRGYNARYRQPLIVKIEDLPKSSFMPVSILCDYCKEEIFSTTYHHYNEEARHINKHACKNCWSKKQEEVVMMKYGVKSVSQVKEFQKKREQTLQEHYGVSVPLKSKEIKDKLIQTVFDTYGVNNVSQLEEIKEQKAQTTFENFGVRNPSKNEDVKAKMRNSCINKYGFDNPKKSPEVRAKSAQTFYKNGTTPTSKQQRYIFNFYKSVNPTTELNYPISCYSADICFPEEKIELEYDGGFHDGQVKTGRMTQEEFDHKELIRDKVVKSEGYKIVRIKSNSDKLPSDTTLLQMLQDARNYFSEYPNHSWIEFNLDTSLIRNAENKQGVHYDFGTLRRIKDEDLQQTN